jgi:ferredoxin
MVENPEVPVELEAKARRAALGCPENAIVLEESSEK